MSRQNLILIGGAICFVSGCWAVLMCVSQVFGADCHCGTSLNTTECSQSDSEDCPNCTLSYLGMYCSGRGGRKHFYGAITSEKTWGLLADGGTMKVDCYEFTPCVGAISTKKDCSASGCYDNGDARFSCDTCSWGNASIQQADYDYCNPCTE